MNYQLLKFNLKEDSQARLEDLTAYLYEYENEFKGTLQRIGLDILSIYQDQQFLFLSLKVRDSKRAWEMLQNEKGKFENHVRQELDAIVESHEFVDNLFDLKSAGTCTL